MCKIRLVRAGLAIGNKHAIAPPAAVHSELFTMRAALAIYSASLANGLGPGREPRLAGTAAGFIFAQKVREHDFMREERRPFKGGGAVGVGAADKLVLAVGSANQFGVAELADVTAAIA